MHRQSHKVTIMMPACLPGWLVGWLAGWLAGWLLVGWLVWFDCLAPPPPHCPVKTNPLVFPKPNEQERGPAYSDPSLPSTLILGRQGVSQVNNKTHPWFHPWFHP